MTMSNLLCEYRWAAIGTTLWPLKIYIKMAVQLNLPLFTRKPLRDCMSLLGSYLVLRWVSYYLIKFARILIIFFLAQTFEHRLISNQYISNTILPHCYVLLWNVLWSNVGFDIACFEKKCQKATGGLRILQRFPILWSKVESNLFFSVDFGFLLTVFK